MIIFKKLQINKNINRFENRDLSNNRPSSSAQPNKQRRASRQQTSNFGSDAKLGFSQGQLIKTVIELETSNLLEMPILTQIKRQILAENSEISSIIEGYLLNEYNKQTLSEKLKKAIIQTNHFDRPTSPWPKREKIIKMFENIISKQLLTDKEEVILRILIEKNDQQLMGTFSDGRGQDELVKSLKRIATQYFKKSTETNNQISTSQRNQSGNQSLNQSGKKSAEKGTNYYDADKVNNFFQQQEQYQQILNSQENQANQNNRKEQLNKKLDFNSGGEQFNSSDQLQYNAINDQFSQGSDQKQRRTPQGNNKHQSPSSSAQFATIQRQILSESPIVDNQVIQQPHFLGDMAEDSPLHTIQINQQLNQARDNPKQSNLQNVLNDNNNILFTQSINYKKVDPFISSQQQSNEDLQIFSSNSRSQLKDNQNNQQAQKDNIKQSQSQKGEQKGTSQVQKLEQSDYDDLQNIQNNQKENEEISDDSCESTISPLEFMDDCIDQFSPEDYGMAIYLINQQNDDILSLFQEIIQLSKSQNASQSTMPIRIMVSNKYKEVLRRNFRPDELNLIEINKSVVTTSIFAVHQSFRVQCDLDQFINNLRHAIQRDQQKQQNDEFENDQNSNRQIVGMFKGYQEKIHADEILQESCSATPNNQSSSMQQNYIQDNQQSFSKQQYEQPSQNDNEYNQKNNQQPAEFLYKPEEPQNYVQNEPESTYQERITNSAAKKQGLINLHNTQSQTEINLKPATNVPETTDFQIRKRLRTESLQVETNAKFSPRNKKQQSQRQPSPERTNEAPASDDSERKIKKPIITMTASVVTQLPPAQQSHFGLINLKKLQQIDVQVMQTGMNVQDNDLNEILSNEINEFYCSYIYNENDRLYDEIVNLSSTSANPISKKALELFNILYQVNDLEIVDIIEEYKRERNLNQTKDRLNQVANYKRRSSFSSIQSVNNKIGKFNLFKKLLTVIEVKLQIHRKSSYLTYFYQNQYRFEKVDFLVQQYLFLHDDVVTLAAFEAYSVNSKILTK